MLWNLSLHWWFYYGEYPSLKKPPLQQDIAVMAL